MRTIIPRIADRIRAEDGLVLPAALIALGLVSLIVGSFLSLANTSTSISTTHEMQISRQYAAEAGIEYAVWGVQHHQPAFLPPVSGTVTVVAPFPVNSCTVSVAIGGKRIYGTKMLYSIVSHAISSDAKSATARSTQWDDIIIQDYDMFQFAVLSTNGDIDLSSGESADPLVTSTPDPGDGNIFAHGNINVNGGQVDGFAVATGSVNDPGGGIAGTKVSGSGPLNFLQEQTDTLASYYTPPGDWSHPTIPWDGRWYIPPVTNAATATALDDVPAMSYSHSWGGLVSGQYDYPNPVYQKNDATIQPSWGLFSGWEGLTWTFHQEAYFKKNLTIQGYLFNYPTVNFNGPVEVKGDLTIDTGSSVVNFYDSLKVKGNANFKGASEIHFYGPVQIEGATTFGYTLFSAGPKVYFHDGATLKMGAKSPKKSVTIQALTTFDYPASDPELPNPIHIEGDLSMAIGTDVTFADSVKIDGHLDTTSFFSFLGVKANFGGPVEIGDYLSVPFDGTQLTFNDGLLVHGTHLSSAGKGNLALYLVDGESTFNGIVQVENGNVQLGISAFGDGFTFNGPLKVERKSKGGNLYCEDYSLPNGFSQSPYQFDTVDIENTVYIDDYMASNAGVDFNGPARIGETVDWYRWWWLSQDYTITFHDLVNIGEGLNMTAWTSEDNLKVQLDKNVIIYGDGGSNSILTSQVNTDQTYIPVIVQVSGDLTFRDSTSVGGAPLYALLYAAGGTASIDAPWYDGTLKGTIIGQSVTLNHDTWGTNTVAHIYDPRQQSQGLPES